MWLNRFLVMQDTITITINSNFKIINFSIENYYRYTEEKSRNVIDVLLQAI
jgi:hypothetical protein